MLKQTEFIPRIGLDIGVFAVKGVLIHGDRVERVYRPTSGNPAAAAKECLTILLKDLNVSAVRLGLTGNNAKLVAEKIGISFILEVEALQSGLAYNSISADKVLSLGHENMYYLEFDSEGAVTFFNRNGQCAAGSGSFWYQQATRMGYNDRELAEVAAEAASSVKISGRCAVFAKSDMTHAINEGASQMAVAAGMAKALVDLVITGVVQSRIEGPGSLITIGGVANNKAILKYLEAYCQDRGVEVVIPSEHEYINAFGAAQKGEELQLSDINPEMLVFEKYVPQNPLPPLQPGRVHYCDESDSDGSYDLSTVYLGVDCGSVSTKCALLDGRGHFIGGVYLPTAGRPALQVLELIKKVEEQYGDFIGETTPVVACTTGSGRFLAQKILNAEDAVDEITCQAEGVKTLFGDDNLSIIEIGGEDSKFVQIKNGTLYDYNMNPVCAAGTGTFLENLAELLGVKIKEEFSQKAFQAEYAIDLGDTCTLLSQSTLVSAAARGLPIESQLASLAYSSARNYLNRTTENRPLDGKLVFTGATAKNYALAAAFAGECDKDVFVPPHPELTGALGAALMARVSHLENGHRAKSLDRIKSLNEYKLEKKYCQASCRHELNCHLDVIKFADGSKFIYGDRCGRFSEADKKRQNTDIPDFQRIWENIFKEASGEAFSEPEDLSKEDGVKKVGIACSGLYYELFPFWAAFFRSLGTRVVLSGRSDEEILEKGKMNLAAEMCYPIEVLLGHYSELVDKDPDYIFIPEVIDLEPLPFASEWPSSLSCPLLMMIRGVSVHSLNIPEEKVLHAQLNYREGPARIKDQMLPVAKKLLGDNFSQSAYRRAVDEGYRALNNYHRMLEEEGRRIIEELKANPDAVVAIILGRSYTLYDPFVSKDLMSFAAQRDLIAMPQDFLLEYMRGWYEGRIESPFLDSHREDFERYMEHKIEYIDNIYPVQLQHILSAALIAQFLNEISDETGLPQLQLILQDPFRCGPNSMLRHFLDNLSGYLRLTLDEHTAPAGMITRLEAFKNTCRSRKRNVSVHFLDSRTTSAADRELKKVLIPNATKHPAVFAALFEREGIEAELLPRNTDRNLTLARKYANGEECLPFIQNLQDYLEYSESRSEEVEENGTVLFQGWSCGPCRYGLYAPTQSLLINRAGYGAQKVFSVKIEELIKRFGPEFIIAAFDGLLAIDMLYKMLHRIRPYESNKGEAEEVFESYCEKVYDIMRNNRFKLSKAITGRHLEPLERLLEEAAERFASIPCNNEELRPQIMVAGEFYVRIDDRCNQDIIKQIEEAGGEVSLAPATEVFSYTSYTNYRKQKKNFAYKKSLPVYLNKLGYAAASRLAHRDQHRLEECVSKKIDCHEEPSAHEMRKCSEKYIPEHTAGEPPLTVGRTGALAGSGRIAGAVFVGPFTCMPASVVEAQQGFLSRDISIPIITVYYDGRDNANRDEFIQSLVFQAKQNLMLRRKGEEDKDKEKEDSKVEGKKQLRSRTQSYSDYLQKEEL